jgi:hypothetical protein
VSGLEDELWSGWEKREYRESWGKEPRKMRVDWESWASYRDWHSSENRTKGSLPTCSEGKDWAEGWECHETAVVILPGVLWVLLVLLIIVMTGLLIWAS